MESKKRETRLRNQLKKQGYLLRKSRVKSPNAHNLGDYMIIDIANSSVIRGSKHELTLKEVENFVNGTD